jgi:hypothetical protein
MRKNSGRHILVWRCAEGGSCVPVRAACVLVLLTSSRKFWVPGVFPTLNPQDSDTSI